ncbi:MAG: cysteine hydrolase [Mesorhizobium sp.]|nr:MAG: cysteine hydrolase [Mesorhizobium sp.]
MNISTCGTQIKLIDWFRIPNRLVGAFRSLQLPVIWVRQKFRSDFSDAFLEMRDKGIAVTIQGTRGAQLHAGLDWQPRDATIIKKRYSAFLRTGLDELLAEMGIDELVLYSDSVRDR